MNTVAGMYFVNTSGTRSGQEHTPGTDCSMGDAENHGNNLSEDDNTSCSNSELGSEVCNLTITPNSLQQHRSKEDEAFLHDNSSSRRKNKRKNFMPRNIVEYASSDEDDEHAHRTLGHGGQQKRSFGHHHMETEPIPSINGEENSDDDESGTDGPLDLSEVQNDSKRLWRKPDFMNSSSLSFPGGSFLHSGRQDLLHPTLTQQFLPFTPIDLRLSALAAGISHSETNFHSKQRIPSGDFYNEIDEVNSTTNNSSNHGTSLHNGHGQTITIGSSLLNNHLGNNLNNSTHPSHLTTNSVLTDFAESTMKELIGLYGIAENLRQAGGKGNSNSEIPNLQRHLNLNNPSDTGSQNKQMMLPENMARLLAAMQESVNGSNNNNNSNQGNNGRSQHNSSPLSTSSGHQSAQTHSALKAQLNNNNQGEANNINENTNSSSGFPPQFQKTHKAKGKSPGTGRGLNSFPVIREGLLGKGTGPVDYTRYVRRFGSFSECGYGHCRDLNYREHFHCLECAHGSRVFLKKEEMIRHFKWHKKRDESLQHGFMRYSPSDDCTDRFGRCPHNRKQTHYHCLQDSCEKVYISTSDVQMHANYHRKDSAIIQEGFQRFRAAEDCGSDHCSFRHQRTTHFHCRRSSCSYTFKNKADMEKHKSYHVKDEQLNRDGFKKFMKHEICQYSSCRFSRVCNHIHCIREGCNYVLHSSGQLYSHKRKHERRDSELAYRKFKLAQSVMRGTIGTDFGTLSDSFHGGKLDDDNSRSSVTESGPEPESEDPLKKFITPCNCEVTPEDHYHCRAPSCVNALLGTAEIASEHSRSHELEDRISSLAYFTVDPANFDAQDSTIPCVSAKCLYQYREKHHHCLWDGCSEVILGTDEPFRRLEHFKEHERTQKLEFPTPPEKTSNEGLDGFFRRKRGRPPKNRIIEVSPGGSNEAIFTSFKLPKPRIIDDLEEASEETDMKDPIGFLSFPEGATCPDNSCSFNKAPSNGHYHCGHPRCHFSVGDVHKLSLHLRDFHSNVDILDGYEYFDKSHADCQRGNCEFNGSTSHFHCLRDGFIFSRYSSMSAHETDCHETKSINGTSSDEDEKPWSVAKSKGSYYHLKSGKKQKESPNEHNPMDLSNANGIGDNSEFKPVTDHSLSRILQLPSTESSETQFGPNSACGRPFCKLKRKIHFHCHLCNQAFSDLDKLRPHVLKHSNLTPLKNAQDSDDATSESSERHGAEDEDEKINLVETKLFPAKIKKEELNYSSHTSSPSSLLDSATMSPNPNQNSSSTTFTPTSLSNFLNYPPSHSPYLLFQNNPLTSIYAGMMFGQSSNVPSGGFPGSTSGGVLSPPPPPIGVGSMTTTDPTSPLTKRPSSCCSSPSSPPEIKKQRLQLRILKDEPVPEGYVRFRFNEDCTFVHCGYREHQTHFHCTREDCGYSFCDKTRFVQHTARHERLDTLMGPDFKQYRANVSCGRPACSYIPTLGSSQGQNKASHFHCLKCEFVCTDTNKVVAHRRQHQKLDSIMAAGFEKFTPSQNCHIDSCIHAQKQTHYHCLKCSYAVLGLSQMSAHKYRHAE